MLFPPCLLEHVSILYSGYYHVYRIPSWLFLSQPFEDVTRLTSGFCSCWRSPPVTGFQQFDCDVLFGLVLSWCVCFILPGLFRFLEPWVCSFHQIWENFQHFKKESLPGSFSVFYQDSSSKCARLSGIVAHVSEAVLDFLSVCFLWDRLCCSCLKVSPVLSFSLLWSAVNHLPWHFLVKYFSFLKVFLFSF